MRVVLTLKAVIYVHAMKDSQETVMHRVAVSMITGDGWLLIHIVADRID